MTVVRVLEKLIEMLVAAMLLVMVVLVFTNVVLRLFNSGIPVTDEISRILLGALIFIGAVIALAQGRHIGMSLVVDRLPPVLHKLSAVVVAAAMLFCDGLLFKGAWDQALMNLSSHYPLSGLPASIPYFVASFSALLLAAVTLVLLLLALTGRIPVARFFSRQIDAESSATE